MSEKRILIASLLKPVNDTRNYEKIGVSLSKIPGFEVHICGYKAHVSSGAPSNIFFHPLFSFNRISFGRFKAQVKYYRFLQKLKPDIILVGTHELLLASYFYSTNNRTRLIYDIRENYALNLLKQHNYDPITKKILAWGVRKIETFTAPAIEHFMLAERSYAKELPFLGDRYTFVENKYQPVPHFTSAPTPVHLDQQPLKLLYTGTISTTYGIFEAISMAEKLYRIESSTTLTIIGYCAKRDTLLQLQNQIKSKPYVRLIGGDKLVPHKQILHEIANCNLGLLPYQPNDSTSQCIPTKLYEYMAHALPILIQQNPLWHSIVMQYQAGLSVDFKNIDPDELINSLRQTRFYTSGIPQHVFWETEEKKLLFLFKDLKTTNIKL